MRYAVDVQSADPVEEEEKGRDELAPVRQREAHEGEVILHEDGEAQNPSGRQQKRAKDEDRAHRPLAPRVGVFAHLGDHQQLQAEDRDHDGEGHHAPDGNHAHAQPLHVGQPQVGAALQDAAVADGAEVPQPEELAPRQQPAAVADGDGREDDGDGHAQDDQAPDQRLEEGFLRSPLRQQPLRLQGKEK